MVPRIALAWVLTILAVTPATAQIPVSRDLVPTRTSMSRLGLERHWMAMVPAAGTERVLSISLAGNLVFAKTNQASFNAYDAESGRLIWTVHLGDQTGAAQPASVNSRLVFVTNSNKLFAVDRQTGREVWVVELPTLPTSPTACDEQRVMVGLSDGKLTSFELYDPLDEKKVLYETPHPLWNWQTGGGALTSRPVPAEQFVAFGGRDGRLYVSMSELSPLGLPTLLYRVATGGEIFGPLGTYGTRTVLVPSADKNVYAVDLFTASVTWSYASGAPVMQEPIAAGDDVYAVNTAGLLTCLDARTGEPRWRTTTHGGRVLSIGARRVYLESQDGDLFIVDRGTGQVLADPRATLQRAGLNLRHFELSLTNNLNDRLYLASRSGLLFCVREAGQLQPRPLRDPKLPPFGTIPPEGVPMTPSPTNITPGANAPAAAPDGANAPATAPDGATP